MHKHGSFSINYLKNDIQVKHNNEYIIYGMLQIFKYSSITSW